MRINNATGVKIRTAHFPIVAGVAIALLFYLLMTAMVVSGAIYCTSDKPGLRCTVVQFIFG